jgi:hypothetical protein
VSVANAGKTYGQDNSSQLTGTVTGVLNGDPITATYASAGSAAAGHVTAGGYAITATLSDGGSGKLMDYSAHPEHDRHGGQQRRRQPLRYHRRGGQRPRL